MLTLKKRLSTESRFLFESLSFLTNKFVPLSVLGVHRGGFLFAFLLLVLKNCVTYSVYPENMRSNVSLSFLRYGVFSLVQKGAKARFMPRKV